MTKEQILAAVRKAAAANAGKPLGRARFAAATGISEKHWAGKYWIRWSDLVRDAGLTPNSYNVGRASDEMLERLTGFVAELGHFPVTGELKLKRRADATFPDAKTFSRFGSKADLVAAVASFAEQHGNQTVVDICQGLTGLTASLSASGTKLGIADIGYVYLVQHGTRREFKVGRTTNPLRREGEVAIELPRQLKPLHVIKTDDPAGVEAYWHRRFAEKRLKGEWFALSAQDVAAFKRWRRIV
jgi:hypothetical protein